MIAVIFEVTPSADGRAEWRRQEEHRAAQQAGRGGVFDDYRLRVASVIRDYGMNDRAQAPAGAL